MTNESDNSDKPVDDNENLVRALESIKTLLATSETKLNQARQSISQASAHSLKMTRDVPVLDEVIIPGKKASSGDSPQTNDAEQKDKAEPTVEPKTKEKDIQLDLAQLRTELEQEMKEKLTAYTQKLEEELKARIEAFISRHDS
ncbi:MAG: hypothetical protein OEY52_10995 [Gammaproteobacteria bacterium]|nr:hypothetical protein [Gammaproteobacteria bacterium]